MKKAGINYPAMQQGQPMRSGCAPAEPYLHGCTNRFAKKSEIQTSKGHDKKTRKKRLKNGRRNVMG